LTLKAPEDDIKNCFRVWDFTISKSPDELTQLSGNKNVDDALGD
jgi:hypothetical protein